jgi:hypothetical protein
MLLVVVAWLVQMLAIAAWLLACFKCLFRSSALIFDI